MQPLGILKDVLVQVNELIFPTDFYVLDMEDETSGKGSTLILECQFFMTTRTKIDVHVRTLLMEFGDNQVQFNIFEVMKYPTEDHSLFSIDIIDELVDEYIVELSNFVELAYVTDCFNSVKDVFDSINMPNMQDLSDSVDSSKSIQVVDTKILVIAQVAIVVGSESDSRYQKGVESDSRNQEGADFDFNNQEEVESDSSNQMKAESDSGNQSCKEIDAKSNFGQSVLHSDRVGQPTLRSAIKISPPHSPPIELKPLLDHLKYAYLDDHQHFPVIIANNLHREQEEKLLNVLGSIKRKLGGRYSTFRESTPPSVCIKSYWRKKPD
ncbi:hypothetical protein CR513_01063, partial [Mucuna pruriens]